jgi:SET family sugar efflux transporter-like MFS transporter
VQAFKTLRTYTANANAEQQAGRSSRGIFIALSLLTGLTGAFIHPLMSLFLVDGLGVEPIYIGVYMVSVTLSGLCISQIFGSVADKGWSARKLYMVANGGIILALLIYIHVSWFAAVLIAGLCFMAMGNASMPQMLTLSRQWANTLPKSSGIDMAQFNAQIRASISFAWMLGPPVAFWLLSATGFQGVFWVAITAAFFGIVFVRRCVPEHSLPLKIKSEQHNETTSIPLAFYFLTAAVTLGSMSNNMYTSALPLHTIKDSGLPSYTPGLLMGLVAGIEIPVMLLSGRLSKITKKSTLMIIAFAFGMAFYLGMFHANTLWQLLVLQFINAVFYGLFAGIGLTLMQDMLPQRVGFTSAVYSNAFKIGVMLGASSTGLIGQYFEFRYAFLGAGSTALLALMCMGLFLLNLKESEL